MGSVHQMKREISNRNTETRRVVVVTGASSGVGRAVARAFGAKRAHVALLARNVDALNACAREIERSGGEALVCSVDVSDAAAVESAAAQTEERWGPIDVWVNVAMATVFAPVDDTTPEEYRRVTEVTYLGYVHGTLAALRRMRPRNSGTIVQVGSALAFRSIPLQSAYCAAKAAIRGFTDALRTELIHDDSAVRVTQVHLPAVNTPQSERQRNKMPKQQQPVPPLYSPEAIAEAILWAADHAPRQMLVGMPTVKALWGQKFIPGLLDRYLARAAWEPQFVNVTNEQKEDILFNTLPGDPGAHGPYRDREQPGDFQMRLRMHPVATITAAIAGLAVAFAAVRATAPTANAR
jgi:NADP-dependent 3-hydroxy acid dehydrogenase YdfG